MHEIRFYPRPASRTASRVRAGRSEPRPPPRARALFRSFRVRNSGAAPPSGSVPAPAPGPLRLAFRARPSLFPGGCGPKRGRPHISQDMGPSRTSAWRASLVGQLEESVCKDLSGFAMYGVMYHRDEVAVELIL